MRIFRHLSGRGELAGTAALLLWAPLRDSIRQRKETRSAALNMSPTLPARCVLYTESELAPVIDTMARQVLRFLSSGRPLVLVGILRRGEPLAQRLAQRLGALGAAPSALFGLRLKRYADDLTLLHPETDLTENPALAAADLSASCVLVVDDVLYEGHSLLRAVAYLAQRGAGEIRTAVLVDRGVTRLPIHADVVGLRLEVAPGSVVECHVPPFEPDFRIEWVPPPLPAPTG